MPANALGFDGGAPLPTRADGGADTWARMLLARYGGEYQQWYWWSVRVWPGPLTRGPCGHPESVGIRAGYPDPPGPCPGCRRARILGTARYYLSLIRSYLTASERWVERTEGRLSRDTITALGGTEYTPAYRLDEDYPLLWRRSMRCAYCCERVEGCTCTPCAHDGCDDPAPAGRAWCDEHSRYHGSCPYCGEDCGPYPCNECGQSVGCGCCTCTDPGDEGGFRCRYSMQWHGSADGSLPRRYVGLELELVRYYGDPYTCSQWGVSAVYDGSIAGGAGCELRLSPARGSAVKQQLEAVLDPRYEPAADASCGGHVHVDARDLDDDDLDRVIALWCSIERGVYQLCSPSRWQSTYSRPAECTLEEALSEYRGWSRYLGLNVWRAYEDHQTIEFRLWPGTSRVSRALLHAQVSAAIVDAAISTSWDGLRRLYYDVDERRLTSWDALVQILPETLKKPAEELRHSRFKRYGMEQYRELGILRRDE